MPDIFANEFLKSRYYLDIICQLYVRLPLCVSSAKTLQSVREDNCLFQNNNMYI